MEATQENFIEFVNRQDRGHSIEHRGSDDFMASWENCAVGVFISQCDTEDSPDSFANEVLESEIMYALGVPASVFTYGELSDFIKGWQESQ
jgi:hypothetical protein